MRRLAPQHAATRRTSTRLIATQGFSYYTVAPLSTAQLFATPHSATQHNARFPMKDINPIPRFQTSLDVKLLSERLRAAKVNDLIGYDELTAILKQDVRSQRGRPKLASARRILEREGMIFECVTNQGVKRLDDEGIVKTGAAAVKRVHRASRRATRRLGCANFDRLSRDSQTKHNVNMSILSFLGTATSETSQKRIEAKVQKTSRALASNDLLEAFL